MAPGLCGKKFLLSNNFSGYIYWFFIVTVIIRAFDGEFLKQEDITGITAETRNDVFEEAKKELEVMEERIGQKYAYTFNQIKEICCQDLRKVQVNKVVATKVFVTVSCFLC